MPAAADVSHRVPATLAQGALEAAVALHEVAVVSAEAWPLRHAVRSGRAQDAEPERVQEAQVRAAALLPVAPPLFWISR